MLHVAPLVLHHIISLPSCLAVGLYLLYIYTLIKNRVGDDGVPAILQYRPSDLYLTDRKETMAILQKGTHTPLHICKQGLPSFILFSHKINYSYKCILMFRAMHGHLASLSQDKLLIQMHLDVPCNAHASS